MLGKKIGKVTQIHFRAQKIAVEVTIDNHFSLSIPVDSEIEVKSEGLIGSKYIAITPGFNRKDYILSGATVEGRREFDISEITPGIVPMTQDLSAFARQLKAKLGEEEKDKIRLTINNIESFTAGLDSLIQSYQNIISDQDKDNFQSSIQNMKIITSELSSGINKEINKLDQILDNVKTVTDKSDELSTTISGLRKSTEKLNEIFDKLKKAEGTLGKLINDDTIHDNMNSLITDIRALVKDFKNNPTKYMKAYWKGKKK
jgi:phospholipid/cholesterol/gamma-HCH transport system substrate-binding protein